MQPLIEAAKNLNISIGVGAPSKTDALPHIGTFIIKNSGIIGQYAICADINNPQHTLACHQAGCNLYMAGVLISDSGYAADAKVLAKSAKNTGMLGAIANHNKPSGGWAVSGKSAIWSKTGLLASADDTSDALVVATSASGIWKGSVIHL